MRWFGRHEHELLGPIRNARFPRNFARSVLGIRRSSGREPRSSDPCGPKAPRGLLRFSPAPPPRVPRTVPRAVSPRPGSEGGTLLGHGRSSPPRSMSRGPVGRAAAGIPIPCFVPSRAEGECRCPSLILPLRSPRVEGDPLGVVGSSLRGAGLPGRSGPCGRGSRDDGPSLAPRGGESLPETLGLWPDPLGLDAPSIRER
jgi:hypothetical protein